MLASLSLPPLNYFIINFFSFSLLFVFLIKKTIKHSNKKFFFLYGWLFGFGYFFTNLYWISISLTYDQNFKFLVPITVIIIPAFLSLFYGLITYFFILLKPKKIIGSFLTFSLLFGILEFIRGTILTGLPWNLIVYSFSNQLEILSITSIIGTYGLNLFCISLFSSPALLIINNYKSYSWVCIFFLISTIFIYIYGTFYKEQFNNTKSEPLNYKIRAIGSNISIDRFYSNVSPASVIKELVRISNPKEDEKTIFVWPEGIIPGVSQENLKSYLSLFKNFNNNHFLIIGTNNEYKNNDSKKYYNSLSVFDFKLTILKTYNKINLVPFGEFLPFEKVLTKIGLKSLTNNYQSFSPGNNREIIKIEEEDMSFKFLPLICYEIIYSGKLFENNNFDFIINISEDGWFGKSIGPTQHFSHSILRAIENGKYVVRSSNNGIAAIINPVGVVEQKVDFGQSGYVDFVESGKIKHTIFSKYGNKIFGLLIFLYIFLIISFNKIKDE